MILGTSLAHGRIRPGPAAGPQNKEAADATAAAARDVRSVRSRVAWGAIFAGSLMALALFLILGSLWAAVELSMAERTDRAIDAAPMGVAILSLAAMFVGGWTTSRLSAGGKAPAKPCSSASSSGTITALLLLGLAINGILILGSATLLGQAGGGDTLPISRSAAWWGTAGVLMSLVATLAGVLAGFPRSRTQLVATTRAVRAEPRVGWRAASRPRPKAPAPARAPDIHAGPGGSASVPSRCGPRRLPPGGLRMPVGRPLWAFLRAWFWTLSRHGSLLNWRGRREMALRPSRCKTRATGGFPK